MLTVSSQGLLQYSQLSNVMVLEYSWKVIVICIESEVDNGQLLSVMRLWCCVGVVVVEYLQFVAGTSLFIL